MKTSRKKLLSKLNWTHAVQMQDFLRGCTRAQLTLAETAYVCSLVNKESCYVGRVDTFKDAMNHIKQFETDKPLAYAKEKADFLAEYDDQRAGAKQLENEDSAKGRWRQAIRERETFSANWKVYIAQEQAKVDAFNATLRAQMEQGAAYIAALKEQYKQGMAQWDEFVAQKRADKDNEN